MFSRVLYELLSKMLDHIDNNERQFRKQGRQKY